MLKNLLLVTFLTAAAPALLAQTASAMPMAPPSSAEAIAPERSMIQKAWHSGLPHRRIIGDTVYGGTCPPWGCPAWTQRDLVRDPYTGQWYSPRNEARRYYQYGRPYPGYPYGGYYPY